MNNDECRYFSLKRDREGERKRYREKRDIERGARCHWLVSGVFCSEQKRDADKLEPLAILKDGEMHSLELTDLLEDVNDNDVVPSMTDLFPSTDDVIPGAAGATSVGISPDELIFAPRPGGDLPTASEPGAIDISSLVSASSLSEPITTIARADPNHYEIRCAGHLPP